MEKDERCPHCRRYPDEPQIKGFVRRKAFPIIGLEIQPPELQEAMRVEEQEYLEYLNTAIKKREEYFLQKASATDRNVYGD